jgi:hypothetical protein
MNAPSRNLLLSNGATLLAALVLHWDVGWLLWPYWIQSVIIGWYARRRMLTLADFSTDGFTSNGRRVPETDQGKRSAANFFAMHYGGFHAGYCVFLVAGHAVGGLRDVLVLVACGVSFVLSQRETYAAQHRADLRGKPNLGSLMFTPYLRVVPMHAAIIFGAHASGAAALTLFTALKTGSDLLLDRLDRRMAIRSADKMVSAAAAAAQSPVVEAVASERASA